MSQKFIVVSVIILSLFTTVQSYAGTLNACDLTTKEVVEKTSGLRITNVTAKDRGVFTSCTYETDNWQVSVGVIYYPGNKAGMDSAALAAELQKEFERDQAPYQKPEPLEGIGDAAVYYQSDDSGYHAIVTLISSGKASGRLVISTHTKSAALAVARAILEGM